MENTISKSQFKPRALQFFREVEKTRKPLIITDRGRPVLKISPFSEEPDKILNSLRNTVIRFEDPTLPVGVEDWDVLK